jgi:hypothetical protein
MLLHIFSLQYDLLLSGIVSKIRYVRSGDFKPLASENKMRANWGVIYTEKMINLRHGLIVINNTRFVSSGELVITHKINHYMTIFLKYSDYKVIYNILRISFCRFPIF